MRSVRAVQKQKAKSKQIYKPIFDNPYTNENELWPFVEEQGVIVEMLLASILRPVKVASEMKGEVEQKPICYYAGYNEVMKQLAAQDTVSNEMLLFVCNKDSTPAVLLSQIPIAAYMSATRVILVQLPRGTLDRFDEHLVGMVHDGILLVPVLESLDTAFVAKVKRSVAQRALDWLDPLVYKQAPAKLLRTSKPLRKG